MTTFFFSLFAFSLLYIAVASRLLTYIRILIFQGMLLFGITYLELHEMNWINLELILLETIVFKTVLIPYYLSYIIKKNNIVRETEPFVSDIGSIAIVTCLFVLSFFITDTLQIPEASRIFTIVAFTSVFSGLYIIVSRKKIITHIMGYMIIENGIFIFSLAIGSEQPLLINLGILLDIFVSVLVLGMIVNRIGNTFEEMSIENLANLKD